MKPWPGQKPRAADADDGDRMLEEQIRVAMRDAAVSTYRAGWIDSATELLDHLEGREGASVDGCYRGPMPDELREWLAEIRAGVDAVRAPRLTADGEDEPA